MVCALHEEALLGAKEKPLVQERFEHRDARLWLQLKDSLSLRWRHAKVWLLAVNGADALQVIVNRQHR